MPKKTKDLRELVRRVLNRDEKFYISLERSLSNIDDVQEELIRLKKTHAPEDEIRAIKQKETRLVNGLLRRILGSSDAQLEALNDAFCDLKRAVTSNRWEYPF